MYHASGNQQTNTKLTPNYWHWLFLSLTFEVTQIFYFRMFAQMLENCCEDNCWHSQFITWMTIMLLQKPNTMGASVNIWITGNNQQVSNQLAFLYLDSVTLAGVSITPNTQVTKCPEMSSSNFVSWFLIISGPSQQPNKPDEIEFGFQHIRFNHDCTVL